MIFEMTGGAAKELNFKIKAYETEEAMMSDVPKQNTIGVITTTPITSWAFSATEPTSTEAGMVWFDVGTTSGVAFNALKKNSIQVYPISAKQYIDGAWVDKTAKSYQSREWVEWWNGEFYNSGVFSAVPHFDKVTPNNATITYEDTYINIGTVGGQVNEIYEVFGPVNLSGYYALESKHINQASRNIISCLFVAPNATANRATATAIVEVDTGAYGEMTLQLDLSGLNDKADLYVYAGFNTQADNWANARNNLQLHHVHAKR